MGLDNILLIPGIGQMSFRDALSLLAPYSPRLAYNFIDPANSLFQGNTLTPVTSATNPIRVVVDQTQGAFSNPGSEIYTSPPNFSEASWGIIGTGISKSGQTITRTTNNGGVTRAGLVTGKVYSVSISYSKTNAISVFGVGDATGAIYYSSTAESGVLQGYFVAAATSLYLRIGDAADVVTVNSISVREIPGNHATASSDAKRPLFARYPATGRRNLLTNSGFLGAVSGSPGTAPTSWSRGGSPAGTQTYDPVKESIRIAVSSERLDNRQTLALLANTTYHFSCIANVFIGQSWNQMCHAISVPAGSTVTYQQDDDAATTNGNILIAERNDTILKITIAVSSTAGNATIGIGGGISIAGTSDIEYWQPQFEVGTARTTYQRVVTSADITEAGVRDVYASLFDGADDCLQVSGFDLSDTDEVTVIAGVRKLSDAALGCVVEFTANASSNNGAFYLFAPITNGVANAQFASRGTTAIGATVSGIAAPITLNLAGKGNISGDISRLTANGVTVTVTTDQGTGNYSNDTLNIGQRNNATLPLNGYVHYLFICGAIVPDAVLTRIYRGLGPRIGLTV